jgi:glycosyltransferase involved in cell wall biosynthesis
MRAKTFALLVDALVLLSTDIRCRLIVEITGEGSEGDVSKLRAQIVDNEFSTSVRLLGNISAVPGLMPRSDPLLMSSASDGLPIVLIEAALSGLPCNVTDAGGCREVIEACQNGFVVELDDAQALANAIKNLISNPEQLTKYSRNALCRSEIFSIKTEANSHILVYRDLLDSPRGGEANAPK